MTIRAVTRLPARVLKTPSAALGDTSSDELFGDLIETMRASPACVGLAAPQIGVGLSAFVLDVSGHPKTTVSHGLVAMADPVIVAFEGQEVGREGCMSVPDLTANVRRATRVVVEGRDPSGSTMVIATEGFEARAMQHEIDHLNGVVILDRVASVTHDIFRRRVYK